MTTLEDIPTMTPTQHVVEVFKRTYRAGDAGQWERSDAIREAVDRELRTAPGAVRSPSEQGVNDGSHRAIEKLSSELDKAGIAEDLAIETIAKYRHVAQAWPEQDRVPQASYDAHRELVSKKYDHNRVKILGRLLKRSSRGRVTRADVRTYKSEMKDKKSIPFEDRVERLVRKLFKGELRPTPTAVGEWDTIVSVLNNALAEAKRELANAKERNA